MPEDIPVVGEDEDDSGRREKGDLPSKFRKLVQMRPELLIKQRSAERHEGSHKARDGEHHHRQALSTESIHT